MSVSLPNTIIPNTIIPNTIADKLSSFISQNKIPHILFHGPSGSGKRTLVYKFVETIYNNDKQLIKNYTMFADCAHGKGIKFIREDLKFFAKTNVNIQGSGHFKTIVLTNADKLTTDAQSALRRCIELFSHNTRFFIIVENKYNLLKPILSRLCDLFIGGGVTPNYYKQNIANLLDTSLLNKQRKTYLDSEFTKLQELLCIDNASIVKLVNKLYEKGYSGLDVMNYIETTGAGTDTGTDTGPDTNADVSFLLKKYELLSYFHKIKNEFRNEKIFMTFILTFFFIRSNSDLENISFM